MSDHTKLHRPVLNWFRAHARVLPWRADDRTAWGVLVSEIMLQQTPVARVEPVWRAWMQMYPTPKELAEASAGDVVRNWGKLGYPRRALRLHETAKALVRDHDAQVPDDYSTLIGLPGIGSYTAAAVASFAFGQRHTVVDTNIRRVLARAIKGEAVPQPTLTAAETRLAEKLLPATRARAAEWNVAVMELGALICTARSPRCDACPIKRSCQWQLDGAPAPAPDRAGRKQAWHGTDRQLRGAVMDVLRAPGGALPIDALTDASAGALPINILADATAGALPINILADATAGVPAGSARQALPVHSPDQADALARLRSLAPEQSRLARIVDGLVADGLARVRDGAISLPD
ncbi:A/G-specific adenine glycosylase [Saxibacter everestensis]|uniref:A/G-specific adenine glycosylase n=1 Tax=Saxibacter everestensis TaxID=2909229 RepID=A0ABY8QPT5_9MICO|nr:A/G-specific adenine glycosylase [Brevibacteriaceae bacterium ZFBP1038]